MRTSRLRRPPSNPIRLTTACGIISKSGKGMRNSTICCILTGGTGGEGRGDWWIPGVSDEEFRDSSGPFSSYVS